jgi:putative membrane protein (TIGR04086 family)
MKIRWMAVLTGVLVDVLIGSLLSLFTSQDIYTSPVLSRPGDVVLLGLPVILTAVSGYVAGRIAKTSRAVHGLLVQVVIILISQLGPPPPRALIVSYALACGFAALGGYLSRFPGERGAPAADS